MKLIGMVAVFSKWVKHCRFLIAFLSLSPLGKNIQGLMYDLISELLSPVIACLSLSLMLRRSEVFCKSLGVVCRRCEPSSY